MKKKILIVVLIATMLVSMLALPAFADVPTLNNIELSIEDDEEGFGELYAMLPFYTITEGKSNWKYQYVCGVVNDVTSIPFESGNYETRFKIVGGKYNGYFKITYEADNVWYTFDSRNYDYDEMKFVVLSAEGSTSGFTVFLDDKVQFRILMNFGLLSKFEITDESGVMSSSVSSYSYFFGFKDTYFRNLPGEAVHPEYYSDVSVDTVVDIFSKYLGPATYGDNVEQRPVTFINMMFGGFTPAIAGLAGGIKDGVMYLLWENPLDSVRTLSNFSIFVFVIAGLSIAMTVFFLIFRLIRHGKQR